MSRKTVLNRRNRFGCSVRYLEDKWSAYTKPDSLPGFKFDEGKLTRLPLRSHLMYTNRWNLYKAKRLKAEPLCPFSQLGIYFTTSIEPAVSGWWRAKARPNFGAQLPQDSSNPCWWLPLLLTRPLLPLIDQIGSCHRLDLKSRLSSLSPSCVAVERR